MRSKRWVWLPLLLVFPLLWLACDEDGGGGLGLTNDCPQVRGFPKTGIYPSTIALVSDPAGHQTRINMPRALDLNVKSSGFSGLIVDGPDPWVRVIGHFEEAAFGAFFTRFNAEGRGVVAGALIAVTFKGTLTEDVLCGHYTMGVDGGLPGGEPITYRVEGQSTP